LRKGREKQKQEEARIAKGTRSGKQREETIVRVHARKSEKAETNSRGYG